MAQSPADERRAVGERLTKNIGRETIYFYCAIFAFLVIVLSPLYLIDFAHVDDFNLFDQDSWDKAPADEIRSGRFLLDRILHVFVLPIIRAHHTLSVLPWIRLAATAVLAVAATLLAVHLRQLRLPFVVAFGVCALIFVLPGAQEYVGHINQFAFPFGLVFGIGGGMLLASRGAGILRLRSMSRRDWLFVSVSILMLLLACNTYQGSAMCFLLPIAGSLLFAAADVRERIAIAATQVGVFCTGLILYYLSNKFIFIPLGAKWLPAVNNSPDGYYHFDITSSVLQKLIASLTGQIPVAARLWWFDLEYAGYAVLLAIILGTLALTLLGRLDPKARPTLVFRIEPPLMLGFIAAAVILANAPSVLSNAGGLFLRLLFPCSALLVLLLAWIGSGLFQRAAYKFRVGLVAAVVVAAGISAHLTVNDFAAVANVEVIILRDAIGRLIQTKGPVKELFIIRPPEFPTYFGHRIFSDEFNSPNTRDYGFAYAMAEVLSQKAGVPWLEIGRLRIQPVFDPAYFNDEISSGINPAIHIAACESGLVYLHDGAVIADMAAPMYLAPRFMTRNLGSCAREFAYYDASPEASSLHSSLKLFDLPRSADSFWETRPYPVIFRVRYAEPKVVKSYELGAPDDAARMPVSWRLEASIDDVDWVTLDERQDQASWTSGQQRKFPIATPAAYRYYRFVFTKGLDEIFRIAKLALNAPDIGEPMWTVSYMGGDGQLIIKDVPPPHGGSFVEGFAKGKFRVEMNFPKCQRVSRYRFWVGPYGTDSTDRQPGEWTLFVRGDNDEWVRADHEQMHDAYANDRWYTFALHAGTSCVKNVRWDISKPWKSDFLRLYEFQLGEP